MDVRALLVLSNTAFPFMRARVTKRMREANRSLSEKIMTISPTEWARSNSRPRLALLTATFPVSRFTLEIKSSNRSTRKKTYTLEESLIAFKTLT